MSSPELTEYLFLDKARLESYFQQVSGPVTYDKTPVWKTGLSLIGPTAEATQNRTQRVFTDHEKAVKLSKFLHDNSLIEMGRLNKAPPAQNEKPFFVETMSAVRIAVGPGLALAEHKRIFLWVSETPSGALSKAHSVCGPLILVEDYLGADDERARRLSSFSSLLLLADTLNTGQDRPGYINEAGLYKNFPNPKSFDEDPIGVLKAMGATLGPTRVVTALFRLRASCAIRPSDDSLPWRIATIGYPLLIALGEKLPH